MKKAVAMLMLMAFTALPVADVVMPPPHVEAGYVELAKKRDPKEEAIQQEIDRLDKAIKEQERQERERQKEPSNDRKPKFNGIG